MDLALETLFPGSRVYLAFLQRMGKALLLLGLFVAAEAATAHYASELKADKNRPVTKVTAREGLRDALKTATL